MQAITWLDASQIQPSQFYINEAKWEALKKDFDGDLCDPIPVAWLEGCWVMTDGHTRTCYWVQEGRRLIPTIRETADLNWEAYRINIKDCRERGVLSALDLPSRLVNPERFKEEWKT